MKEESDKPQKSDTKNQVFTNVIKKVCIVLWPISTLAMLKNKTKLLAVSNRTPGKYESVMAFHIVMQKENAGRETNFMQKFIHESFRGGMKKWPVGEAFECWRCWLISSALNQPGCQSTSLLLRNWVESWCYLVIVHWLLQGPLKLQSEVGTLRRCLTQPGLWSAALLQKCWFSVTQCLWFNFRLSISALFLPLQRPGGPP